MTNFDWFFIDTPSEPDCHVTSWGSWSPCSARCGRGRRLRTRVYLARDVRLQDYVARELFAEVNRRFSELQMIEPPTENITATPEIEKLSHELIERCQFTLTIQEALCDGDDGSCDDTIVPEEVCKLHMSVVHCRGYQERWFFDYPRGACEPFGFSGCGGNANNFRNLALCKRNCLHRNSTGTERNAAVEPATNETVTAKKWKPTPSNQDNEVMVNDAPMFEEDVDCQADRWLGWSVCHGNCEYAVKLNYRIVVRPESGQGRPCRRLVKSRTCKPAYCRHTLTASATTTESPHGQFSSDTWPLED